jgi:hypothetical protein
MTNFRLSMSPSSLVTIGPAFSTASQCVDCGPVALFLILYAHTGLFIARFKLLAGRFYFPHNWICPLLA